jgi:hypothetical protein
MATPTSKPMVIGAAIARFYDMAASETSASLPHPTPSAYYNRRHEKEKEKEKLRELSRNISSGGTGRVPLSRIRALQEKLVPESGDEAERTRSNRRQLLNAILADAPTPHSTPAPLPRRSPTSDTTPTSTASTRAAITTAHRDLTRQHGCGGDRARARAPSPAIARKPSRSGDAESPVFPPPPPAPLPQTHAQRLARPRASTLSLKDATHAHAHGAEDSVQRGRPAYSERRSATERRPSTGKPQWHRSSPDA